MRVGKRRGCKTITWPGGNKRLSSSICGTWVDLPEPVGALRINRLCVVNASRNRCSISQIGKSGRDVGRFWFDLFTDPATMAP
jgi:hypothetical protein